MKSRKAALYLRVSTKDQNLDSQREELERSAKARGLDFEVFEDHASGAQVSRAGLDEMMRRVRRGEFGSIMVYKLDRLARSVHHFSQIVMELDSIGVGFVAVTQGIDTTDRNPAGRLQWQVLAAVAEFERELISERTKSGLEATKAKGVKLGRKKGSTKNNKARAKAFERIAEEPDISCATLARVFGVSKGTAHNWKKAYEKENGKDGK